MTNELVLSTIVDALEDVKGQDICVYDTAKKTSAFSHVVICSGTSNRQTRALANSVSRALKEMGRRVHGIEGSETGEWVLVDLGDLIVHIMQPPIRNYYRLEEIWGETPIDLDTAKTLAVSGAKSRKKTGKAPSDTKTDDLTKAR